MIREPNGGIEERIDERLGYHFPERQIVFRSEGKVSCLHLSSRLQAGATAVFLLASVWIGFTSVKVFFHDLELAAKDAQIANVRVAYRSLLGEVADYQKRFSGIIRDLEENHSLMLSLAGQNNAIREQIGEIKSGETKRKELNTKKSAMNNQLGDIEGKMEELAQRNFSLKGDLHSVETDLQAALSERNSALLETTKMRRDIKMLENQLVELEESENATVERLTEQTGVFVSNMERVIEMAGLDADKLLAQDDTFTAQQGGPFIALGEDERPAGRLKVKLLSLENQLARSDALQAVMQKIPLASPLETFYLTSPYGKRRDPVNRRWSVHYGLDMGSTARAPIRVPSPGTVSFAGWKGNFGKLVEIDHGAGIKTRYGHLSAIKVKKGQKVKFGEKLGLMGSTGRSTGAHLHYEVLFNGKNINPLKIFKAGRHVFQEQ